MCVPYRHDVPSLSDGVRPSPKIALKSFGSNAVFEPSVEKAACLIPNLHWPVSRAVVVNCRLFDRAMTDVLKPRLNPLRSTPNLLTLFRICLAPFLVSAILENRFEISFVLFLPAGLTDALDGLMARWLKQSTILGQYLDPVADKLLLSTLFLVLMYKGLMPLRVTVLVFGRDVGILLVSAILYAAVGRREFYPSIFGKANTLAQISAVAAGSAAPAHARHSGSRSLRQVALDATIALTVASGLHYAWLVSRRTATPAVNGTAVK